VVCLHPADAEAAQAGGADRVQACAVVGAEQRSLEPAAVSAIVRATDLPVRVTVRLSEGLSTQGGELTRLVGLAGEYLALGAEGCLFGFLTRDLTVDVQVCAVLADALVGAPWTFDRAFDAALDARQAWRSLRSLDGIDSVQTSGAQSGPLAGIEDLLDQVAADPTFAAVAVAAGGVRAEDVPWLLRAGVTRLNVGSVVRQGGSWTKARVDPGFVRSWRLLLDDAAGMRPHVG
jgi:copper homeostasis protein